MCAARPRCSKPRCRPRGRAAAGLLGLAGLLGCARPDAAPSSREPSPEPTSSTHAALSEPAQADRAPDTLSAWGASSEPAGGPDAGDASAGAPAGPASDSPTAHRPAGRRRYVVAAIGDSLTDARSHGGGYLERLRERCPASRFDNYGVGGQMVNQMRRRFARDVLGEPPDPNDPKPRYDHLLVLGGINDICSDESAGRSPSKIRADLEWIYRAAKARGIRVVALTMPPWGGFDRYYNGRREAATLGINDWIRDQVGRGVADAVVDIYPLLSCGRATHLCERYGWPDRVHWSAEGHRIVGEALHRSAFPDCL